jgi:diguanylate cyclase (GGDEF)-like protein
MSFEGQSTVPLQRRKDAAGIFDKLKSPKGSLAFVLIWPIVCCVLAALLWLAMLSQLDTEKKAVEQRALQDASVLAKAYAHHLTRTLEQVDQVTLLIKYEWNEARRPLRLEDFLHKGIFPLSQFAFVTIIDRRGKTVTSTLPVAQNASFADRDYFHFHASDRSQALRVGTLATGRVSGKTIIQFTRRLETRGGLFDGIVLVSVEPGTLFSFYDGSDLGKSGLLAIVGSDRVLRVAGIGGAMTDQTKPTLRAIPAIGKGGAASLHDEQWFGDRQPRFIASEDLKNYPLTAIVGLSVEERLAPRHETWDTYRNIAITGSVFLFFFALTASVLAGRLVWRKHQEAEVQEAYRLATEGGSDGFYMLRPIVDKSGTVTDFVIADCNERGAVFISMSTAQLIGARLSALYPQSCFPTVRDVCRKAMEIGFYEDEVKVPAESPIRLEWVYRRLVRSGAGLAVTLRDISAAKAHERELTRMANEDPLTALPNRNWLMSFLPAELEKAGNTNGMLALLFVDLDDFKDINDSLGHSVGDELLHAAALRLKVILRPTDSVIRLGGDEFTVILTPLENESDAAHVAERIIETLHRPFELSRGHNTLSASIGISIFPRDGDDAETLLKNSDIAMYHAKSEGKGLYRFYRPALSESLKARLDNERALLLAIEQDQFVLFYQPRIDTFTGELHSMEALVRWMHPQRGLAPPLEFIPLAEETGLILKLGELVFEKACAQIARWKALDIPLVPISINVSPRQFNHGDIKTLCAATIGRHHIEAELIELEITESSMMGNEPEVIKELGAIRNLGIKLLVDDFGTGYSSLSQLQRLDMDILKVDRAFTAQLGLTTEGEVFFHAIVSMAHALGMSVVAEGVETSEQLRVLQSLCCDEVQGNFISWPVPAHDAQQLMVSRFLLPLPRIQPATGH